MPVSKPRSFKSFITCWKYDRSLIGDFVRDVFRDQDFPLGANYDTQKSYLQGKWVTNATVYQSLKEIHSDWKKFQTTRTLPTTITDKFLRQDWLSLDARGAYCLRIDNQNTIRTLQLPCSLYSSSAPSLVEVNAHSIRLLKEGVEVYAHYFRREFRYDFVQFYADETGSSWRRGSNGKYGWQQNRFVAWLFLPRHSNLDIDGIGNSKTVGACCFRWREWVDAPHGWALQWIWLHPYFRRQGILSNAWSVFTERFGSFHVEEPLSEAMYNFLLKVKTPE